VHRYFYGQKSRSALPVSAVQIVEETFNIGKVSLYLYFTSLFVGLNEIIGVYLAI
jgi:hypothetical protein